MALSMVPSTPPALLQAIYDMIDADRSGFIDFPEYMVALSANRVTGPEAKLAWMFGLFDCDGSGDIEAGEMRGVLVK